MRLLLIACTTVLLHGCATAAPWDIFWPTRQGVVTSNYLGELSFDRPANGMYHSLMDTKAEKALIPVRKMYLEAVRLAAKGETDIIDSGASLLSNGLWVGLTALLGGGALFVPRPGEKALIREAELKPPPE